MKIFVPLLQHIGAPLNPIVNVGDRVLKGQKIADAEGLAVPVHAPVSGTVTKIEKSCVSFIWKSYDDFY